MELSLNNIESRDKVKVGGHEGIPVHMRKFPDSSLDG